LSDEVDTYTRISDPRPQVSTPHSHGVSHTILTERVTHQPESDMPMCRCADVPMCRASVNALRIEVR
jgi:hypothetical protein